MNKFSLSALAISLSICAFAAKSATSNPPATVSSEYPVWPKIENDIGISLSGDFLYWQANQTGMAYGEINNYHSTPNFTGDFRSVQFEFDPGVRATLGVRPRRDNWEIDFVWTHLNTKAKGSLQLPHDPSGEVITPFLYPVPIGGANATGANAVWQAWYNTIDLDFTKEITLSDYFGIKAHMGLRNLWLNERYNLLFNNNIGGFPGDGVSFSTQSIFVEKIWGLGPMIGVESIWKLWYGLGLFGKASFSLLWTDVRSSVEGSFLLDPPVPAIDQYASFHTTLPEIDLIVGGVFDTGFCEDRYHLSLQAGWELRTLFEANFLGASYASNGRFSLSGLTTGFTLDF